MHWDGIIANYFQIILHIHMYLYHCPRGIYEPFCVRSFASCVAHNSAQSHSPSDIGRDSLRLATSDTGIKEVLYWILLVGHIAVHTTLYINELTCDLQIVNIKYCPCCKEVDKNATFFYIN